MTGGRAGAEERGFALLLVLWTLALLTLIVSSLVAGGRGEARLAANLRAAAVAEAVADGAVHEAVFRLLDPSEGGWRADGTVREIVLPGGRAAVGIEDLGGLVDPNAASEPLLAALLRRAGADPRQAAAIAAAMADWRDRAETARPLGAKAPAYRAAGLDYGPPGAPFRSVAEVRLVLGMTPAIFAALAPNLSLFRDGDPEGALAPPMVQDAIREVTGQRDFPPPTAAGLRVFAITATAAGREGGRFVRRAVVRVGAAQALRPWRILAWERIEE